MCGVGWFTRDKRHATFRRHARTGTVRPGYGPPVSNPAPTEHPTPAQAPVRRRHLSAVPTRRETLFDPADAWDRYRADGGRVARNELITHYAPLVGAVARKMAASMPPYVEVGDLISHGIFGLIDALEKFDPHAGVRFETYASVRVRGAIIDGLRHEDWVPRSVRAHARALDQASEELHRTLGRAPTSTDMAAHLGITIDALARNNTQVAQAQPAALDKVYEDHHDGPVLLRVLAQPGADPAEIVDARASITALAGSLARLEARRRLVIVLRYFEGLALTEIGTILGVTVSRVSQMHTEALATLRRELYALDAA